MINKEKYQLSTEWAEKIFHYFLLYINNEENSGITKEALDLFSNLIDLEWFDHFPLCKDCSEDRTRLLLTIIRYLYLQQNDSDGFNCSGISKKFIQKMKKDFENLI